MQNGTGVGRKRTQDSSSSLAVFSMNLLAFRNTVCSVSFIFLSLFEELQGSMDSPQETGALWVSSAREQILISACSGLFTLRAPWM